MKHLTSAFKAVKIMKNKESIHALFQIREDNREMMTKCILIDLSTLLLVEKLNED